MARPPLYIHEICRCHYVDICMAGMYQLYWKVHISLYTGVQPYYNKVGFQKFLVCYLLTNVNYHFALNPIFLPLVFLVAWILSSGRLTRWAYSIPIAQHLLSVCQPLSRIFSKTPWQNKATFCLELPCLGGTKVCLWHLVYMTKMAIILFYREKWKQWTFSSPELKAHNMSLKYTSRAGVRESVRMLTLSNMNISETSEPIKAKFYVEPTLVDLSVGLL